MKNFLLILIITISLVGCSTNSSGSGFRIGDKAYNIEVEDINGSSVKLNDFKGKKVFILAWTSTWGECLSEFTEIHEVLDEINKEEVELLLINLTEFDNMKSAKMAVEMEELEEIAYFDVNASLGKEFNIVGVPTALYIDGEGIIRNITYGLDNASGIVSKLDGILE